MSGMLITICNFLAFADAAAIAYGQEIAWSLNIFGGTQSQPCLLTSENYKYSSVYICVSVGLLYDLRTLSAA